MFLCIIGGAGALLAGLDVTRVKPPRSGEMDNIPVKCVSLCIIIGAAGALLAGLDVTRVKPPRSGEMNNKPADSQVCLYALSGWTSCA